MIRVSYQFSPCHITRANWQKWDNKIEFPKRQNQSQPINPYKTFLIEKVHPHIHTNPYIHIYFLTVDLFFLPTLFNLLSCKKYPLTCAPRLRQIFNYLRGTYIHGDTNNYRSSRLNRPTKRSPTR